MLYGFHILISAQFFEQRRTVPLHPHCPTYSSLLALKQSYPVNSTRRWGNKLGLTVWAHWSWARESQNEKQGELEEHKRIFLIWCLVWSTEPAQHRTAVSVLARSWDIVIADSFSGEISYKLYYVSPDNCKPHILKDFFLSMSQMGRPPPGRFRVNAPKLGGARAAQRKCHYFFFRLISYFLFRNSWIVGWPFPKLWAGTKLGKWQTVWLEPEKLWTK